MTGKNQFPDQFTTLQQKEIFSHKIESHWDMFEKAFALFGSRLIKVRFMLRKQVLN